MREKEKMIYLFFFPSLISHIALCLMLFSQSRTEAHLTLAATGGVLTINAKYFTFSIPESFYC